eukprot:g9790.t1
MMMVAGSSSLEGLASHRCGTDITTFKATRHSLALLHMSIFEYGWHGAPGQKEKHCMSASELDTTDDLRLPGEFRFEVGENQNIQKVCDLLGLATWKLKHLLMNRSHS